jgi:hypothetical protein
MLPEGGGTRHVRSTREERQERIDLDELRARIRRGECTAEEVEALDAAGLLPHDDPAEPPRVVQHRSRSFVQIVPAAFDALVEAKDLSADAQYVLLRLLLVVDWRFAERSLGVRELMVLTRLRHQRLRAALNELTGQQVIETQHSRGHGGFVRVLVYPDVVHRSPARRAALIEHLAEAQSRTPKQRAGQTPPSLDPPASTGGAVVAHAETANRGNSAVAHAETTQLRTPKQRSRARRNSEQGSPIYSSEEDLLRASRAMTVGGPPGADLGPADEGDRGADATWAPPRVDADCDGCVDPDVADEPENRQWMLHRAMEDQR